MSRMPKEEDFMRWTLEALQSLGRPAAIAELDGKVKSDQGFSVELLEFLELPHDNRRSNLEYRLAWSRTALKHLNAVENVSLGIWALTDHGRSLTEGSLHAEYARFQRLRRELAARRRFSPPVPLQDSEGLNSTQTSLGTVDEIPVERNVAERMLRAP